MGPKKTQKLVIITKKKHTHRCKGQASGYQFGEESGKGNIGVGKKRFYGILWNNVCES